MSVPPTELPFTAGVIVVLGMGYTPYMTVHGSVIAAIVIILTDLAVSVLERDRQVRTYRLGYRHGRRVHTEVDSL